MIWLPLYGLFYIAVTLYWARLAARANGNVQTWYSAGHSLPGWISALVVAGASVSGWGLLVVPDEIARNGFGLPALLQIGVLLALPGVVFFKRLWLLGQRFRLSSQGELFRAHYQSEFLVVVSALLAVVFAIGFSGVQIRALGLLAADITNGAIAAEAIMALFGVVVTGYVVIGGMRAIGYLGAVQAVLGMAALIGLTIFALVASGGLGALNAGLVALGADPAGSVRLMVTGVIQFTAGLGREAAAGHEGTAVASLSLGLALMGMQASPVIQKIVLSTASPRGIAAGQTWVLAGAFGGLAALCGGALGAAGLVAPGLGLNALMADLSPWFSAWAFVGAVCAVQLFAGLSLFVAAEALVRTLYKPWLHGGLSHGGTVALARIVVALLALLCVLLQALAPVTLSALAALALPLAAQLWVPLLGMTWVRWFTRPAVLTGVGFGIGGVLLTEAFGIAVLGFLGLDLPWGRWPWTIHSAAWGLAANLSATILISLFTQRRAQGPGATETWSFLASFLPSSPRVRPLRSTAWSATLGWFFFAVGPGLVFGNIAFGAPGGAWMLGVPSQWGWALAFWAMGLGLVWFLSYRMEMASPLSAPVPPHEPAPRLPDRMRGTREQLRLRRLVLTATIGFALIVFVALAFGNQGVPR